MKKTIEDKVNERDLAQMQIQNEISRMNLKKEKGEKIIFVEDVKVDIIQYIQGLKQAVDANSRYNPYNNSKAKAIVSTERKIKSGYFIPYDQRN